MARMVESIVRHCIALEHPRWTWDQIMTAVREAEAGRGPYAILLADLLASREG